MPLFIGYRQINLVLHECNNECDRRAPLLLNLLFLFHYIFLSITYFCIHFQCILTVYYFFALYREGSKQMHIHSPWGRTFSDTVSTSPCLQRLHISV
jgi:hypothetical protein